MKNKKTTKILSVAIATALLMVPLLVTVIISKPQSVSAAVCNTEISGGGGGIGSDKMILRARSAAVESSVKKMGFEFTPQQAWATDSFFRSNISLAKSDCSYALTGTDYTVSGTELTINFTDSSRTSAFVSNTDYKNVASGVTVSSSNNDYASATYTIDPISQDVSQLISVDIGTEAGWENVYLKQGDATEVLLVSFKIPTDAVSFYSNYNTSASVLYKEAIFSSAEGCSDINGSGAVRVRVLADGSPVTLATTAGQYGECNNYDKTTYDAVTKTASLKWDTAGEVPKRVMKTVPAESPKTISGDYIAFVDSLAANPSGSGYYMIDNFESSNSAEQPVYIYVSNYEEGKSTPPLQPYPIAGGVFDFSSNDIDLSNVTFDVSADKNAALAHNLNTVTKDGTFTLFASRNGTDEYVGICPGATDINAVDTTCSGLYFIKEGETKGGVIASIVTVGATQFWQVSGLMGTGVFSSTIGSIPGVGNTGIHSSKTMYALWVIAGIISMAIILQRKKLIHFRKY